MILTDLKINVNIAGTPLKARTFNVRNRLANESSLDSCVMSSVVRCECHSINRKFNHCRLWNEKVEDMLEKSPDATCRRGAEDILQVGASQPEYYVAPDFCR
jgi:hypothetical protein